MTLATSLLLAAAVTGTVDVSDRSEIRFRDSNEATGPALDVETAPAIGLRLRSRAFALDLGYGARLVLRQNDHAPIQEAMHHGLLGLTYRFRRGEIGLRGEGNYGTQSFASLMSFTAAGDGTTTPIILQIPPAQTIGYVTARAGMFVRYAPNGRWTWTARADYLASGGTDEAARALVPFQQGPAAALGAEVLVTRRDRLSLGISYTRARFSPGPDDTVGEAQIAIRHRFDRRAEGTIGAGAAVLHALRDGRDAEVSAYPAAEAGLAYRFLPRRIEARCDLRLGPVINWVNGAVDERIQGNASLAFPITPAAAARAALGIAQGVPIAEDAALTVVVGEAAMTLRANRSVELHLGTRGAWQKQRGVTAAPPQWVLFAGATFTAPTLRF